jgi:glyoxylase-like metal-dependent hydrolase (beta-lactamase superfamily II)
MTRGANRVDSFWSMEFWAEGMTYALGQAYRADGPWPGFKTQYHATLTYETNGEPGMRVEMVRTNPDGPIQGGGGLPLAAPQKPINVVSGKYAWNETQPGAGLVAGYGSATPAMGTVNDRSMALWLLPPGIYKAAVKAGADAKVTKDANQTVLTYPCTVAIGCPVGMNVKVTLNSKNQPDKVETRLDNAVLGDVVSEFAFTEYADRNDAKKTGRSEVLFPGHIVQKIGGFPVLDIRVTETDTDNPYVTMPVPDNVHKAGAASPAANPQASVNVLNVGEGVYYLMGPSHHSVLVEFAEYVALIECPVSDARALAVLEAARKTVHQKPLRYVIATHHHFDHLAGLRACAAQPGVTVLVHGAGTKAYLDKIWTNPRTIRPDIYAKTNRKATIEAIVEKRELSDSTNALQLYHVQNDHADSMLLAYFPRQKTLMQADFWNPPAVVGTPIPPANRDTKVLIEAIQRLKLDVAQLTPVHGRVVTIFDLQAAAGPRGPR